MKLFDASQLSGWRLAILDIAIKTGVFFALLLCDFVSAGLSKGVIQLPMGTVTLPLATLLVSQLDGYFVKYAQDKNIPVPSA